MPNTYTQIHIQCVFAVKYRDAMINVAWEDQLQKYITAILQNHGHKMLAINNMPDHLHLFFGFRPDQSLSDLMRIVKGESSKWINEQRFTRSKFNWQEGYGAFSYSRSHIKKVCEYIQGQKEHHQKVDFLDEYRLMLKKFDVEFNERYIFCQLE